MLRRPGFLLVALSLALCLVPARAAGAQFCPAAPVPGAKGPQVVTEAGSSEGCVRVLPDDSAITRPSNTSGLSETFWVVNESPWADSWDLYCTDGPPQLVCTSISPTTLSLNPGDSAQVTVYYDTGPAGSVTLQLMAVGGPAGTDWGTYNVTIVGPPSYAVAVTPDGGSQAAYSPSAVNVATFTVQNNGNQGTLTYSLSIQGCTVPLITCVSDSSTVQVNQGASKTVTAHFDVQNALGTGSITLRATHTASGTFDNGSINVSTSPQPLALDLSPNFGDRLDKTGCVVGGAGPGGAFYCGELLVAQPMVGYRSMNEVRSPTLVYGSRAASGTTEILANVTLKGTVPIPDYVVARFWLDGQRQDSVWFGTTGWSAGTSRRLVIPVSVGRPTGVYWGKVEVTTVTGQNTEATVDSVPVVIVRRDNSPFGAGWWLAGVSRAYTNLAATAVAFAEAEGSAVVFRKVGAVWQAPQGETSTLTASGTDYVRTLRNRVVLRYDVEDGRLKSVTDPVGNVATYTWSPNALDGLQLDNVVDAAGKVVQLAYVSSRLRSVTVPGALPTTVYVSAAGDVDSIADPDGVKTKFVYAAGQHRMSQRTGRRLGEATTFYYGTGTGVLDSLSTPDGKLLHRAYQREGLPRAGQGTSSSNQAISGFKDSALVVIRDYRRIATAKISVDRLGRPTKVTAPYNSIVTITRDVGTSLPTRMEWSPLGRRVDLYWNVAVADLDSTIEVSDSSAKTSFTYHPTFHYVTQVIQPTGEVTRYAYNALNGLLDTIIAPGGDRTEVSYNSRGQVRRIQEFGHTQPVLYQYDSVSGSWNLLTVTTPVGNVTTYEYNPNRVDIDAVVAPDRVRTTFQYDALKRVRQVETYDASGFLKRRVKTDYLNSERTIRYTVPSASAFDGRFITDELDPLGQVVRQCNPVMETNCHRYTITNGLLELMYVAEGGGSVWTTRAWAYDSLGRIARFEYLPPQSQSPIGAHAAFGDADTLGYNQVGAITYAANSRSIVRRTYYPSGRLACEHQTIKRWDNLSATNAQVFGIRYSYDRSGRLLKRVFGKATFQTPPTGNPQNACAFVAGTDTGWIRQHYDSHGRVDSLIGWNLKKDSTIVFTFQFDAAGRRSLGRNSRNGWEESWTYDEDDRPKRHLVQDTRHIATPYIAVNDSFAFRDEVGRVLRRFAVDGDWLYQYDGLGQVTRAGGEPYTYDAYGAGQLNAGNNTSYQYDQFDPTGRLNGTQTSYDLRLRLHLYRYNRAGDRRLDSLYFSSYSAADTSDWPRQTLTNYDGAGRPVEMKLVGTPMDQAPLGSTHWWTFWYDALGRRILVADSTTTLAKPVQRFFYDGLNVVASGAYMWQSGTVDDEPWFLHHVQSDAYLHDLGVDRPLYWAGSLSALTTCAPSGEHFYLSDEQGSVKRIASDSGAYCGSGSYAYEAYGKFTSSSTISNSQPGYTGAASDASGLVFLRNRYYDPNTRTFTQPDPIGVAGGINLYGYVGNDPINFSDPFGLCKKEDRGNCTQADVGTSDVPSAMERAGDAALASLTDHPATQFAMGGLARAGAASGGPGSFIGRLLGKPNPVKLNSAGRLQPYSAETGRYLSNGANPGLGGSPALQFTVGFGEGYAEGMGGGGTSAPLPVTRAQQWGQFFGKIVQAIMERVRQ